MKKSPLTYASTGVQYEVMDPLKRLAQKEASRTAANFKFLPTPTQEIPASRGESAYVWQEGRQYKAMVVEGLGTKNLVADAMAEITGKTYYEAIAQDTVAMIINDLIVVGAQPQVVSAYFGVGDSNWFANTERTTALVKGWAKACDLAGAVWGGGETPTNKGIIMPTAIDLGGSAVGVVSSKKQLVLGDKLAAGDAIVLIESNGIHANGLTLARTIASQLPKGYKTKLKDGSTYGETLLKPTHIYAQLVKALFAAKLDLHYMVNITGHGWRKLMRATKEFTYTIETIPEVPPLFTFIQKHSGNSDEEMYGNFNMGAGFAIYLPAKQAKKVLQLAKKLGYQAWQVGMVETGPKQVVIKPKKITFHAETLGVR
jgi:phosphoribosylformylglycinamidine cyclo-ligase